MKEKKSPIILKKFVNEIQKRGGEIAIDNKPLQILESKRVRNLHYHLLGCEGWRQYSIRFGSRPARMTYLCGMEDNLPWAVRVAGSITKIKDALDWIVPAEVKKAIQAKKKIIRQGDVYIIPTKNDRASNSDLPRSHRWNPETRMIEHPEHPHVHIPFSCKFIPQKAYGMGRTNRFGFGD